MTTRVSVILANFNYGRFLASAIDSVLGQDWPDVEIIVVDDGSTDDSIAVIESYGDKVIGIYQANSGQSAALNAGFERATGQQVIFLDSDDELTPGTISKVVAAFSANPQLVRVQWRMEVINADGRFEGILMPPDRFKLPRGNLAAHVARFRTYIWNPTSSSAYSATALKQIFPIPVNYYKNGSDLYLSENIVFLGPVGTLDDPGSRYRIHGNNDSITRRRELGEYARDKIREMVVGHELTRNIASRADNPVLLPSDPRKALDWAFLSYRLASLRAAPELHPIKSDHRLLLALRGAISIGLHPMFPPLDRAVRAAWFIAAAAAPAKLGRRLLERVVIGKIT